MTKILKLGLTVKRGHVLSPHRKRETRDLSDRQQGQPAGRICSPQNLIFKN